MCNLVRNGVALLFYGMSDPCFIYKLWIKSGKFKGIAFHSSLNLCSFEKTSKGIGILGSFLVVALDIKNNIFEELRSNKMHECSFM